MINLSRQDKDLLLGVVREALAEEPAELEVFSVTGEEILREAISRRRVGGADSDAFFGGLDHSLAELLMHLLVLAAAEAIKHGWVVSRERLREILAERRRRGTAERPELAQVENLLIICLVRETGEPYMDTKPGEAT
jgi:hypothetical protein